MKTIDAGASYILVALLPRLEELKPGLLEELVHGIQADKATIKTSGKMTPDLEKVFRSAEDILVRASG